MMLPSDRQNQKSCIAVVKASKSSGKGEWRTYSALFLLISFWWFGLLWRFGRVRTIPGKLPNTQYPIELGHTDINTQYQYRYPSDHQPTAACCRTVGARRCVNLMSNVICLRCFALSVHCLSAYAVYAVPGVRQPHLILTAIYNTRLHYILPFKISMQFPSSVNKQ